MSIPHSKNTACRRRMRVLGGAFLLSFVPAVSAQTPQSRLITASAVALDTATNHALVVNAEKDRVERIDLVTGSRDAWATGKSPAALVLDGRQRRVYVVDAGAGTVSVLDADNGRLLARPRTDERPYTLALDRRAHRVFVSNTFSNEVTGIGTEDNAVQRLPLGSKDAIAIDEERGRVFFSSYEDSSLTMLQESDGKIVRLPGRMHTWALAVVPATGHLLAAVIGADTLLDVDVATGAAKSIEVGGMPDAIAIAGDHAYVANRESSTVSVIDLLSDRAVRAVAVGRHPGSVAVGGDLVWVANTGSSTLTGWNRRCPDHVMNLGTSAPPYGVAVTDRGDPVVAEYGGEGGELLRAPQALRSCTAAQNEVP